MQQNESGGRVVITADHSASGSKGALNSWLADKYNFDMAINNWMPNAGHYTELDDGTRILVQHIPSAFINKNTELYICPGGSIDIDILENEIDRLESLGYPIRDRLTIHPHTNIITDEDKETERRLIKTGSTFKGCGASVAGKALRQNRKLAKDDDRLSKYVVDQTTRINNGVSNGMKIIIEGSQGIDLDLNYAEFPYTTSRQTHPTQLAADAGLPCQAITNVIINLRAYPIRINNQSYANNEEYCYTGNYWDGKEISWEEVALRAGWSDPTEFIERYNFALTTSVTKMRRRVFEFPVERFRYVNALCGGQLPNSHLLYSLNFLNFVDKNVEGKTLLNEVLTPKILEWLNTNLFPVITQDKLRWLRTGPRHSQIVEYTSHTRV